MNCLFHCFRNLYMYVIQSPRWHFFSSSYILQAINDCNKPSGKSGMLLPSSESDASDIISTSSSFLSPFTFSWPLGPNLSLTFRGILFLENKKTTMEIKLWTQIKNTSKILLWIALFLHNTTLSLAATNSGHFTACNKKCILYQSVYVLWCLI